MADRNPVPDGYHSLQPYLYVQPASEAIAFYQRVFGARQRMAVQRADGSVQHAELEFGDSVLMLADGNPALDAYPPGHYGGSPVGLFLYTADCDAMYRAALAAGATTLREPADQPHGDRMAGVKDPFGYSWWLASRIRSEK